MADKIRWGILGTGRIAGEFAQGLQVIPDAEIAAVGSRSQKSADAFGDKFGVIRRHPSYQALAADPDIDVVYVATPHTAHRDNSILCLEHSKPVVCEKPFAINRAQVEEIIAVARGRKLFLMEAMWTRFIPLMVKLREMLVEGVIGDVRMVHADFCFRVDLDPDGRLFNPNLGGGALLDVGIYPIALASMIFGKPNRITSMADIGVTGIDEQSAYVLGHEKGQLAVLCAAVRTQTFQEATIFGTEGTIHISPEFWRPTQMQLHRNGEDTETIAIPYKGNGYNYEAQEVMSCLRAGKLESDVMPLSESVSLMETMDTIRMQWGLKYPIEV